MGRHCVTSQQLCVCVMICCMKRIWLPFRFQRLILPQEKSRSGNVQVILPHGPTEAVVPPGKFCCRIQGLGACVNGTVLLVDQILERIWRAHSGTSMWERWIRNKRFQQRDTNVAHQIKIIKHVMEDPCNSGWVEKMQQEREVWKFK